MGASFKETPTMKLQPSLLLSALLLSACVPQATTPAVPTALVPAGEHYMKTLNARGAQIYQCRMNANGPAWVFVAPDAELFDARDGRKAGRHYAGPNWEALDGSRIQGTVKAKVDAPLADSIPWLLLATRPSGGDGVFTQVSSVQRINTVGGIQPAGGCDPAMIGVTQRVAYSADYVLYALNPR
jgi:hypothetical protein